VKQAAPGRRLDALGLGTFVGLGLPDGMLGTAWPSMRQGFHAPVGDLGLVLLVSTAGSVAVTLLVSGLIRRLGVPVLLAIGAAFAAAAAVGFAAAPGIGAVIGLALLFGVAAGTMDAGLNTAIGMAGRRRLLNLLHGAYGVGTTIGPLLVTGAVLLWSWRGAYLVLVGVDVAVAILWLVHRHRGATFSAAEAEGDRRRDDEADAGADDQRRPHGPPPAAAGWLAGAPGPVLAGLVVFFVYTGLEVAAGQWETTFGRSQLHLSAGAAGVATFGYWGALTGVRLGLGLLPRPAPPATVVRAGIILAVLSAAVIWWQPGDVATLLGFVVLGGALAGVFPALVALTPVRLGDDRASRAIAWQVGAASAGGAGLSAIVGLVIGTSGPGALGPALVSLAAVLFATDVALGRLAPLPLGAPTPP